MSGHEKLLAALHELGLTPTEAEVYVATLEAAAEGPVSGYRVAQGLGRDPANLAKVMAGLVRQGAVRVVQDKPRLYVPIEPEAFIGSIVDRVQARRDEAVTLLRRIAPADPGCAPTLLPTLPEALATASAWIELARKSVTVHASPEAAAALAPALARAAGRAGCRVAVLCAAPVTLPAGESTLVPAPADDAPAWLELAVDRRRWLIARDAEEPAGCCGEQPAVGAALADGMDVARRIGEFRAELSALEAACGGADRPAPAAAKPREAAGAPDKAEPARPEGLTFIIRHDRED